MPKHGTGVGLRALTVVVALAVSPQVYAFNLGSFLGSVLSGGEGANSQPSTAEKGKGQSFGARMTEQYCRNLFSVAAINNQQPLNEALIEEEFKLTPKDFFDAALKSFNDKNAPQNYTFPSLAFYQGEFESDKVNVLYNLLLSYPSSQYVAALITEARKTHDMPQYDHQAKVDAIAALTILQFRMQKYSRTPGRWKELAQSLLPEEHYTAQVISARLLKSGELGNVDVGRALTLAREAGGLRHKYQTEQGYRTMSPRNYMATSNQTLFEILTANMGHPERRHYDQFLLKYEAARKGPGLAPEIKQQLAPGLEAIEQSSALAVRKANDMLSKANTVTRLKAEKTSLDNATRTRTADKTAINMDGRTMAAVARQLETIEKLDERQKQMFADALGDAHESGDRAVSMMPTMMSAVMNLMMSRGMESLPTILPYSKKLQTYSDNACSVISRWDHAAQLTNAVTGKEAESRSALASMVMDTPK